MKFPRLVSHGLPLRVFRRARFFRRLFTPARCKPRFRPSSRRSPTPMARYPLLLRLPVVSTADTAPRPIAIALTSLRRFHSRRTWTHRREMCRPREMTTRRTPWPRASTSRDLVLATMDKDSRIPSVPASNCGMDGGIGHWLSIPVSPTRNANERSRIRSLAGVGKLKVKFLHGGRSSRSPHLRTPVSPLLLLSPPKEHNPILVAAKEQQ